MADKYDSKEDTLAHIKRVKTILIMMISALNERMKSHDQSKLCDPEKATFDEVTGNLKGLTYGSEEYHEQLKEMAPALKHHYEHNQHHFEHFENGMKGMNIVDLVEMFCDWAAATERHEDGNIHSSIEHNSGRFGYEETLKEIFHNTANFYRVGKANDSKTYKDLKEVN